jgi:periplasmic protein TonB
MNWIRLGSASAAVGVHVAVLGLFAASATYQPDPAALQSGNGDEDITVAATITMQSEESLGLDTANVQQQEASLGGQAAPQVQEEVKKEEEKVELPPEKSLEPTPIAEEKEPEKKIVEVQPSIPAPSSEALEEQRAATRALEARRHEVLSLYNSRVYQALIKNAIRPKATQKGRVVVELTLAPSGELLDHRVVESSGSPALDKTAITSLERAAPFPPLPAEVSKQSHTLRVPFEYAVK